MGIIPGSNPYDPYNYYSQYQQWNDATNVDLDSDSERDKLTQMAENHEAAGVIRMNRTGMPGQKMREVLGMSPVELVQSIRIGLDDETLAKDHGQKIIDSGIKPGTV